MISLAIPNNITLSMFLLLVLKIFVEVILKKGLTMLFVIIWNWKCIGGSEVLLYSKPFFSWRFVGVNGISTYI